METKKAPAKDIPDTTCDFQIEIVGGFTKKRFVGNFTSEIPRIKEQCMIEKHEAMLNGEMATFLTPGVRKMHKMVAYLRYCLTEYPKWWREADLGYELRDLNVIEEVYNKVLEFEEKWMKSVWGDDPDGPTE